MPAVAPDKLLDRLAKGKPIAGVLLLGSDRYLRDLCRDRLVEAYIPAGGRDWGVARFSAAEDSLDRVLNQAQTLPMLSSRQVVFLSEVEALEKLDDDARDAAVARLAAYLDDPAPFTIFVMEAVALDQRMRLAKMLAEKTLVVSVELGGKPDERLAVAARMALEMAREAGARIERDAAEELAEILNADLTAMRTEIEKLAVYAGRGKEISRADVETLVVSAKKYSVWQLADMLAARQRAKALLFLDSVLREGEAPPQVVGAMAWMYRKLLEARSLPQHLAGWQAARELGMRPDAAELALRNSRRIPEAHLREGLEALYDADSRLKSGVASPRAVMEFLVTRLTAGPAPQSAE